MRSGRLKQELDTLKFQYEKSVVYAYKNRSNYDFLNFIFSASDFNDALKRIEYLKSYRQYREQQATLSRVLQLLLRKARSGWSLRKSKKMMPCMQEKEKVVLVEERKEKDEIVSKPKARERELNKELSDKQRADKKLRDGIMAAIRREAEKSKGRSERREKEERRWRLRERQRKKRRRPKGLQLKNHLLLKNPLRPIPILRQQPPQLPSRQWPNPRVYSKLRPKAFAL